MKDYNEIMDSLWKRRDAYHAGRERKKKKIRRMVSVASGFLLVALLGTGIYQLGNSAFDKNKQMPEQDRMLAENKNESNSVENRDESNVVKSNGGDSALQDKDMAREETVKYKGKPAREILEGYAKPESAVEKEGMQKNTEDQAANSESWGVNVPAFIAYNGYLCKGTDTDISSMHLTKSKHPVKLNPDYTIDTYEVEENPQLIALVMNEGFQVYEKVTEVSFSIGEEHYQIAYDITSYGEAEELVGKKVKELTQVTVYEMATKEQKKRDEKAYLVNVSGLLKEKYPKLFDDSEDYEEYWWVAYPQL